MFRLFFANTVSAMFLNFLVAPLTTIHVSMQQSVLPHQSKYGDGGPQDLANALVKTTKEISPHEKRKFELLIKSGAVGQNKPYRAPIYNSYTQCIKGLAN